MDEHNVIYGVHPVREAFRRNRDIKKIYIARKEHSGIVGEILQEAEKRKIPALFCSQEIVSGLCKGAVHQGIAAVTGPYNYVSLESILSTVRNSGEKGVLLILDGILDPVNLGSLIRSAAAWGVNGIIIPKDRSAQVSPTVIKISAGGTEYVPISRVTNLSQTMVFLKKQGYWLYGADPDASKDLSEFSLDTDMGFIIGGEGLGIRRLIKKHCDVLFRIPTVCKIPLNAAVAGATVLYEVMRQRIIKAKNS